MATTAAGLVIAALAVSHDHAPRTYPVARTRATIDYTACLLNPPAGIESSATSAAAWQGILQAQATTNLRAQTLAVIGPDTPAAAKTAVNTLALRGCNLIITATPVEVTAIEQQAHTFPDQQFLIATTNLIITPAPNITVITTTSVHAITTQIARITEHDAVIN
jgi:basic membrane lipoprotein Med (substrate-binding protein (PBP1-ABC) superfamily)